MARRPGAVGRGDGALGHRVNTKNTGQCARDNRGQQAGQRGEYGPIGRSGSHRGDLPQHRQLMAKNQDLHVFVLADIGAEPEDREDPGGQFIQKRGQHER